MIPTEKVDIFIRNTLNQIHALDDITSINYWSDGTDAGQEGQWKWASSGTPIGYTNWAPLEPSHAPEDCLAICGVKGFKWNDDICVRTHPFICERNRKLPVPDL
ncbi:perlucin-like [Pecten maximus]|uniref:perlucin-like n=1 Tax=Pecten maximus TaxID=6579 RepID=UPI001457EE44|nr:perlucin-like [Pecten maximus]